MVVGEVVECMCVFMCVWHTMCVMCVVQHSANTCTQHTYACMHTYVCMEQYTHMYSYMCMYMCTDTSRCDMYILTAFHSLLLLPMRPLRECLVLIMLTLKL